MNYLEKIKKVRENLKEWQKEHGKEFSYLLMGIGIGEDPIDDWTYLVSPEEELEIIKYLERRGFIEISKETKSSIQVKILPKKKPIIKIKTLELISRELKDHYTGYEITKLLEGCGADKKLIIYPNSKWHIFYGLFEELAIAQDKKAKALLLKIICEAIHPLNLGGDNEKSGKLITKFNEYLKYDNLAIVSGGENGQEYKITDTKNLIEIDEETLLQDFKLEPEEKLPDINKSNFSERVIDLVAEEFQKHLSSFDIRKIITPLLEKNIFLKEEPAIKAYLDDFFEENAWDNNIKAVLQIIRKKDENPDKNIEEILENLLHPLNHNADQEKTGVIAKQLEKYLLYDNFSIVNTGKEYIICSEKDMEEMHSPTLELEEADKKNRKEDEEKIKQSKEIMKELRDNHQAYIDVLELFTQDTKKPTKELNDAYLYLTKKMKKLVDELGLKYYDYEIYFYKPFKNNLYSAESEWRARPDKPKLSWDAIRPSLHMVHSNIIKLLNMAEEETAMTDDEKNLEQITRIISEQRTQYLKSKPEPSPMKIEIAKMPDLNVRTLENNTIVKNNKKRITLPKFPRTDWIKISIRAVDERNILLSDGKDTKPVSFESLGCDDGRSGKPDENWNFLIKLAVGNGETLPIPKAQRIKQRKQKQKITDILRKIFQNDTEPFETESGGVYKAKFNISYPKDTTEKPAPNKFSDLDQFRDEMTNSSEEM